MHAHEEKACHGTWPPLLKKANMLLKALSHFSGSAPASQATSHDISRKWKVPLILSRRLALGLFVLGFFLPMVESGSPQIWILPIAESSVVHKILLKLFQRFSIDLLWKIWVPPFSAHDGTACSMEIKPLESGPALRSNRTGGRLDLFHHAPSKARCSLSRVPALLRGRSELAGRTPRELWPPSEQRWDPGKTAAAWDMSLLMSNIVNLERPQIGAPQHHQWWVLCSSSVVANEWGITSSACARGLQGWNSNFSSRCDELGIKTFGKDQDSNSP